MAGRPSDCPLAADSPLASSITVAPPTGFFVSTTTPIPTYQNNLPVPAAIAAHADNGPSNTVACTLCNSTATVSKCTDAQGGTFTMGAGPVAATVNNADQAAGVPVGWGGFDRSVEDDRALLQEETAGMQPVSFDGVEKRDGPCHCPPDRRIYRY